MLKLLSSLVFQVLSFVLQGIIASIGNEEGIIQSDQHGEIPFDVDENFSDTEFVADDVGELVEFTATTVSLLDLSVI